MATETWGFDFVHSSVHFSVRHLMVSRVHGRFARWEGEFVFDEADPSRSRVSVRIDASSVETREQDRDAHLRSADFLDVERHPYITFASTSVSAPGDGQFNVTGILTIRGTARPVLMRVEYAGRAKDPWGGERAGFVARTSIDRKDFGLTWNKALEAGGVLVGDRVEIEIDIEAVGQVAQAAPRASANGQALVIESASRD
jgi:polyisoprenoid-binding protein YceI